MGAGINLVVLKNGDAVGKDISQLVKSIKWSGRRGSPTRTLEVSLLDDDGFKHARSEIDIEEGYQCIFSYDGTELFRGMFMSQNTNEGKVAIYKAYDNGIYLSNNRDTFCYENKTADAIFKDVCTRFGLPMGEVAACSYAIPDLTKSKTTAWDAIADALSLEFDNTGRRYYVFSEKGVLSLRRRRDNITQWVLEVNANISRYTLDKSIEKVRTRIKLLSSEGTVLAEAKDEALEKKIGIMQEIETPDESLNSAQINELANSLLAEQKLPTKTLSLNNVLGLTDVISGIGCFVIIPHTDLNRTLYVEQDSHTFTGDSHFMALKLVFASDAGKDDEDPAQEHTGEYNVGDVVNFNGGYHYVSSTAKSPVGGNRKAGPARIEHKKIGAPHPYSLVGGAYNNLDGDSNVYGWVDEGSFS